MNRISTSFFALIGALGVLGANSAEAQSFRSVDEARAYLAANPTGSRAQQAFRVIADATLSSKYPEFSRRALADGNASVVWPGSGVSGPAIRRALAALGENTAPTVRRPPRDVNSQADLQVY